jgi:hypothetical protein
MVQPARFNAAIVSGRELLQREPHEGDCRGGGPGPSKQIAEEDASVVVDPAQPAVCGGDDSVGLPQAELPDIIGVAVVEDGYTIGLPLTASPGPGDLNQQMSA